MPKTAQRKKKSMLRQAAATLVCTALVAAILSACAISAPAPSRNSNGSLVRDIASTYWAKDVEIHTTSLQESISQVIKLASSLKNVEQQIEQVLAVPADKEGYAEGLDGLREERSKLIEEGDATIAETRTQVDKGIAWIEGVIAAGVDEQTHTQAEGLLSHLRFARVGMDAMADTMGYTALITEKKAQLGNPPETVDVYQANTYYEATWGAYGSYDSIDAPVSMADLHKRYVGLFEMLGTIYYDAVDSPSVSTLDAWSFAELMDWAVLYENNVARQQSWVAARQYGYAIDMLSGEVNADSAMDVEFDPIDSISPNLYGTLDSILDVTIGTPVARDVIIEVEVAGFSLVHTARHALEPGINYFTCKPEMLPSLDLASLEQGSTTQINFKITDMDGKIIEQQSSSVELLSLYDFSWRSDDFGLTAQFDIMAWLRPSTALVDDINRRATDYVAQWTEGASVSIWGYQADSYWYKTLVEVAAIQRAISDSGIAYVNDNYSPRGEQHILTPRGSMDRRQALCIESSILLASCLLSAGMHPYLIIVPGHAQVAVETARDSSSYILLETTQLPYGGLDRGIDANDPAAWGGLIPAYTDGGGYFTWIPDGSPNESWDRYFNLITDYNADDYGGIFVVDCYWQRIMGIYGIEDF